jgi:hypothetical protein
MFGKFRYSPAVDAHIVFQGFNAGGTTSQQAFAFVLSLNAPDPGGSAPVITGGSITSGSSVRSGNAVRQ